jgi:hypothetical protein
MFKRIKISIILTVIFPFGAIAQIDSVVQLYGVVMSADSLKALPSVNVLIKGQNRGTITSNAGVFSIVALKGDQIEFSSMGYKSKLVDIPRNIQGNHYSMVQLLTTDTVFLPAVVVRQRITREQFERDFINTKVPYDELSIARANNDLATRRLLMAYLPSDGREASNIFLQRQSRALYYSGQLAPMNLLNPFAWSEFIKAWKRGDFKKKS